MLTSATSLVRYFGGGALQSNIPPALWDSRMRRLWAARPVAGRSSSASPSSRVVGRRPHAVRRKRSHSIAASLGGACLERDRVRSGGVELKEPRGRPPKGRCRRWRQGASAIVWAATDGSVGWALDPAHASPSIHRSGVGTGDRVDVPLRTGPAAAIRVRGTGIAETGLVDVRVQAIDAERRRPEVP